MTPHPSLQDLTRAVHGLARVPEHVDLCADCLETMDRLEEERDLLHRPPPVPDGGTLLSDFFAWIFGPAR
jgi:hypothetical protein